MLNRGPETARLAFRGLRAYDDFAALKRNYVCRRCVIEKAPVNLRDSFVRNEDDIHLLELA